MYYYPYFLHLNNLLSFTYKNDINSVSDNNTELLYISRYSYTKYKGKKVFTATYNHSTQNYEFDGKRYVSYDELITDALNI